MIEVFLEDGKGADLIATFATDEIYNKCLPVLEAYATECGGYITESVNDEYKMG